MRERLVVAREGRRGRRAMIPMLATSASGVDLLLVLDLVVARLLLTLEIFRVAEVAVLRVAAFLGVAIFFGAVFAAERVVVLFLAVAVLVVLRAFTDFDAVRGAFFVADLAVVDFFAPVFSAEVRVVARLVGTFVV